MMTIDQIVNSLEKLSKGTDFSFDISENKNEEEENFNNSDTEVPNASIDPYQYIGTLLIEKINFLFFFIYCV